MIIENNIRTEIVEQCKKMYKNGLIQGTGGNVSVRLNSSFLITPSGMNYITMETSDIVEMNFEGNIVSGDRTPSIEKEMHRYILNARKDINAVVHTHSIYATAVATTRQGIPPITDNQVVIFGGEIPVSKYATIGTTALAENVTKALANKKGVLMANHGIVAVGCTLEEAVFNAEMIEMFAHIYILSSQIGKGIPFTEEEITKEHEDITKRYGQKSNRKEKKDGKNI
ncbi:MAG: class II aldolase/adducin family protein [Synergistaceae bacterium]